MASGRRYDVDGSNRLTHLFGRLKTEEEPVPACGTGSSIIQVLAVCPGQFGGTGARTTQARVLSSGQKTMSVNACGGIPLPITMFRREASRWCGFALSARSSATWARPPSPWR